MQAIVYSRANDRGGIQKWFAIVDADFRIANQSTDCKQIALELKIIYPL